MADILSDEPAVFAADEDFEDKVDGHIVDADEWNEILTACRAINELLHGGSVPANLRQDTVRLGSADLSAGGTLTAIVQEDGNGGFLLISAPDGDGTDCDGGNLFVVAGAPTGTGVYGTTSLDGPGGVTHVRLSRNAGGALTAGFFGASPVVQQSAGVAASDPASTQTLANTLRTALINLGLIS